jgi:death on curing protein
VRRIEIGDFLLIAELNCGIEARWLARLPRVRSLAEAALAAPFAEANGEDVFPALHEKAAVYCARIATCDALPNGNKRTAYDVMREFLDRNGAEFSHPPGGLDGTVRVIELVAARALDEKGLAAWLLERVWSR